MIRRALLLLLAAVLAALGVIGIVRFSSSPSGVAFHALVLAAGGYLAVLGLRRA